ncbi:MAG: bifunctional hydroxymethylpyrimidine kinase/phosphomethylpyrimidine kinase [bacterium]|nr:MAG: bifunctional hydroxymethylpyrimidine kinase/phosphomethylpyrimidine kinase [bacterium]
MTPICVMTVAGSDSGGGAGIQGDLKTFSALGAYGTSVITAVTAQNTVGIRSVQGMGPDIVKDQMESILEDFPIAGIKVGMLHSVSIIGIVVSLIRERVTCPIVVDPVIISSSGTALTEDEGLEPMKKKLFPLAQLVTPNLPEMESLAHQTIHSESDMIRSCEKLYDEVHTPILLKGGHRKDKPCDILFDGAAFHYFNSSFIRTSNDHGTGCALSSAITVHLAQGKSLLSSVEKGKHYITHCLTYSYPLGEGHGPINHFWNQEKPG